MRNLINERQLVEQVLGLGAQDYDYKSTLNSALCTAREIETSKPVISLLLYLIGMEQLGELFCEDKKKEKNIVYDNNGIVKVFRKYCPRFSSRQLQGIKHLRHSLAHNYGLVCIDEEENKRCEKENQKLLENGLQPLKPTGYYNFILDFENLSDDIIDITETKDKFIDYKVYVRSLINKAKDIIKSFCNLYYEDYDFSFVKREGAVRLSEEELDKIRHKYFAPTYLMDKQQFMSVSKLYHYTSFATALKILMSNTLKFSDFKNTNDINESSRTVLRYYAPNELYKKNDAKEIYDELYKYKQISLSCDGKLHGYAIPSMWGHYAEKGHGICLVFDKKKLKMPYGKCYSHKIIYKNYNTVTEFNTNDIKEFLKNKANRNKLFFTKSPDWKQEQEFRIVSRTEDYLDLKDSLVAVITCCEGNIVNGLSIKKEIIKKIIPDNVLMLHFCYGNNGEDLLGEDGDAWDKNDFKFDV